MSIALVSTKHQHESVMEMFAHVPSHLTLLPFFISILEIIMFLVSAGKKKECMRCVQLWRYKENSIAIQIAFGDC